LALLRTGIPVIPSSAHTATSANESANETIDENGLVPGMHQSRAA